MGIFTHNGTCQIANLTKLYDKYFGEKADGFFVDVGAFDGYYWSNTYELGMAGWHGICFEPLDQWFQGLKGLWKDRPDIICSNLAIGALDGKTKLFFTVDGDLPTTDEETVKALDANYHKYKLDQFVEVDMALLNTALLKLSAPIGYDLLSVDVEGGEWDVMRHSNLPYWKPKMVIIEMHEHHPEPGRMLHLQEIDTYMVECLYEKIQHDPVNSIFIRKDFLYS